MEHGNVSDGFSFHFGMVTIPISSKLLVWFLFTVDYAAQQYYYLFSISMRLFLNVIIITADGEHNLP